MKTKDHIPVLGIEAFRIDPAADSSFQYHNIQGYRLIEKPHKHDFFLFLLVEKGSGTHIIDFLEHRVAAHQIHILFPDQVHTWTLGEDTLAQQIMVSRLGFEAFSPALMYDPIQYQNHPVLDLDAETFQKFLYEFRAVEYELSAKPVLWDIIGARCRIIAQMVSREAARIFEDLKIYHTRPVLSDYHALIDKHFKDEKSVSFYAEKLNISPNYLNILCKRHLDTSATSLIHQRLILEAKRLLLTSKNPIKEIAYDLGFYDLAYFSRFFKSRTGHGPRSFRDGL